MPIERLLPSKLKELSAGLTVRRVDAASTRLACRFPRCRPGGVPPSKGLFAYDGGNASSGISPLSGNHMALHGLLLFCMTYLLATASPGPGIGAILARVLGRGQAGLAPFIAGYVVGDLIWFTLAATGMAMVARTAHHVFLGIKYAGAAYLLYLAYRLWTSPAKAMEDSSTAPQESGRRLFLASLTLTMGNPKVVIFFLALLPTVVDLTSMTAPAFLEIAGAICVILTSVLTAYSMAALRARKLFRSSRAIRWLNRGTGTVMAGAAIAVATRQS